MPGPRRHLLAVSALLPVVLASAAPAWGTDASQAGIVTLAGFEDEAGAKAVTIQAPKLDRVVRDSEFATDGRSALRFDAPGFTTPQGKDYPAIRLDAGRALKPTNWRDYRFFTVDLVNPREHPTAVTVWVGGSGEDKAYQRTVTVPAYGYEPVDIPVSDIASAVDVARVSFVKISLTQWQNMYRTPWDQTLHVDGLKLTTEQPVHTATASRLTHPLIHAMRLDDRVQRTQADLYRVAGRLPGSSAGGPDGYLHEQVQALQRKLADLEAKARNADVELSAAQTLSNQIQAAGQAVQRLGTFVEARRARPRADFGVGVADSMSLVYPRELPCACDFKQPTEVKLTRNEYENVQIAVLAYDKRLDNVRVRVAGITDAGGNPVSGDTIAARVNPVGSLYTKQSPYYHIRPSAGRPADYVGWTPDPIRSDLDSVNVASGDIQPFWVELHAPETMKPGRYRVALRVETQGGAAEDVPVDVQVWPFALPTRPALPTAITFDPANLSSVYGIKDPNELKKMRAKFWDFLEQFKLEPDSIYRSDPPSVADLQELQSKYGLRNFNMFYIDPRQFDPNNPGSWQPKIDAILGRLDEWTAKYREAGLLDHAYIYGFDESRPEYFPAIREVLRQIKARFPKLRTMSTLIDPTFGQQSGLNGLLDIWVPEVPNYDAAAAEQARKRGEQVWWYPYVRVGHPYANWFNGYPPIDTRVLMGPMAHKLHVDGMLYYRVERWVNHSVLADGPFSTWDPATWGETVGGVFYSANGDGSLFYPGPNGPLASIRIQNFRDGMEDYNLLEALRDRVSTARRSQDVPSDVLAEAGRLLDVPQSVVGSTIDHTEDPAAYRAWRTKVGDMISTLDRSRR
jgi:hypothetical protein